PGPSPRRAASSAPNGYPHPATNRTQTTRARGSLTTGRLRRTAGFRSNANAHRRAMFASHDCTRRAIRGDGAPVAAELQTHTPFGRGPPPAWATADVRLGRANPNPDRLVSAREGLMPTADPTRPPTAEAE